MLALTDARVLIDGSFRDDIAVVIDGERIAAVTPLAELSPAISRHSLEGAILAAGFIDVQVNGGGDALFNADPSVATIRRIGAAHARFGTTGFLPTLISDDLSVIRAGIAAVDAAIMEGVPGVLGIHIEGPFINVERKGIHPADKIRAIDEQDVATLTSLRHGRTLVTLAPELAGPAVIAQLVQAGVIVSAGHTAGSFSEVTAGIDAGLTGFTHLFNAMSPLGNREPGAVGAGLIDPRTWCSLIVDGHHVDPVTLRLALRCKPLDRFLLVTDAMPPTGGVEREFKLNDRRIRMVDGRLVGEDGTLAGAYLDMATAVANTRAMLEVPFAAALMMATKSPANFLSLHGYGEIAAHNHASLVALAEDGTVRGVWIDGVPNPFQRN